MEKQVPFEKEMDSPITEKTVLVEETSPETLMKILEKVDVDYVESVLEHARSLKRDTDPQEDAGTWKDFAHKETIIQEYLNRRKEGIDSYDYVRDSTTDKFLKYLTTLDKDVLSLRRGEDVNIEKMWQGDVEGVFCWRVELSMKEPNIRNRKSYYLSVYTEESVGPPIDSDYVMSMEDIFYVSSVEVENGGMGNDGVSRDVFVADDIATREGTFEMCIPSELYDDLQVIPIEEWDNSNMYMDYP